MTYIPDPIEQSEAHFDMRMTALHVEHRRMRCPQCTEIFDYEDEGGPIDGAPYSLPVCGDCFQASLKLKLNAERRTLKQIQTMKRTETLTLAAALDILARDIQSGDGVANAAIAEAAERLRETGRENATLRSALVRATGSLGLVIKGASADAPGHKDNYGHARKALAETESDDWAERTTSQHYRDLGITLLDAKYLDPACHKGCQSLVRQHRIADLERELSAQIEGHKLTSKEASEAAVLRARLCAAERDKERLDALLDLNIDVSRSDNGKWLLIDFRSHPPRTTEYSTARDAIDFARFRYAKSIERRRFCQPNFMQSTSEKASALCHAIEAAGASEQLTKCSVLASELRSEIQRNEMTMTKCAESLNRYAGECFPEIVNGQKHFVRVLMESWAESLTKPVAD